MKLCTEAIIFLWTLGTVYSKSQVLLYGSKSEFGQHAGLYGGIPIKKDNGNIFIDQKVATHCYSSEDGLSTSMNIKHVTVDDWSRSVLITLEGEELTLLKGHTCQIDQICTNSSVSILIDRFGKAEDMGPFAMYERALYFVAKLEKQIDDEPRTVFQVRKVDFTKEECQVDSYPIKAGSLFKVEDCTEFAGALLEQYENEKIKPLDIKLVKDGNDMRSIVSMESRVQEKGVTNTFTLSLILTDKGKPELSKTLKSVSVWPKFSNWIFQSAGGLAYSNGELCWSAIDSIYCGKYQNEGITDFRTVLEKGESSSSGACTGGDSVLSNVTTGVAFVQNGEDKVVFFGCLVANNLGGAGVVTIRGDSRTIQPLKTNTTTIYAGSMAVADDCLAANDIAYVVTDNNNAASELVYINVLLPSLVLFVIITIFQQR